MSSRSYGICVQVIQPFLKFTYLFSLINYICKRHLHHKKSLERIPSLTNTKNQNADFKNYAYFNVTPLVLKEVNVRGVNVLKSSLRRSVLI